MNCRPGQIVLACMLERQSRLGVTFNAVRSLIHIFIDDGAGSTGYVQVDGATQPICFLLPSVFRLAGSFYSLKGQHCQDGLQWTLSIFLAEMTTVDVLNMYKYIGYMHYNAKTLMLKLHVWQKKK